MSIEKELRQNWDSVVYPEPDVPEQPMLLAQAPTDQTVVSDAGAGRGSYAGYNPRAAQLNLEPQAKMESYDPTVRQKIADFLQAGFEAFGTPRYQARKNAQTIMGGGSSNLPLNMGIADIIPFLGTALQTEEAVRTGEEATQSLQAGQTRQAALQAGAAAVGMIPGAVGTIKTAKSLAPKAAEMTLDLVEKTGMPVRGLGIIEPGASAAGKATAPVSDTGFYSAVEQAALNIQRKSGTGQAFLNDITKGENVKADEIKWIGLDDFLKDKKNVTKADVQNFIAQNKVDVQEVTLGGSAPEEYTKQYNDITNLRDRGGQISNDEWRRRITNLNEQYGFAPDAGPSDAVKARFGAYTLPGGQNYREILLTMPNVKGVGLTAKETERLNALVDKRVGSSLAGLDDAEQKEYFALIKKREESASGYKSSHWDQPNVLAHIRVNDRVDADGKKMLLVEEVQSDWHQAGRDKGYRVTPSEDEIQRIMDSSSYMSRADAIDYLTNKNAVPDAPMKDTWYQLALKRVLKYAADNGYERVGLTTGSRQAERYDLSKQIDTLSTRQMNDGYYMVVATDKNGKKVIENAVKEDALPNVVGKELARKIISDKGGDYSGLDLQVGGEGMKKYYDEVYPQFLAKYGKKWGAKVGETTIAAGRSQDASGIPSMYPNKEPVRYIDITPQMKESVGKGQPLFSATGIATGAGAGTMATSQQEPK